MIARIFVQTPFTLSVPTSTQFVVYEFETRGYKVRYFPPKQSDQSVKQSDGLEVKVGGVVAIQADIIHIDFIKDNFNRAHSQILDGDPPSAVIQEVLDFYILRLRHVTKAPLIRPIDFSSVRWRLRYLNDDESELQQQEGLARGRVSSTLSLSFTAVTNAIWNELHSLPVDYTPPPWESLLLDAAIPGTPLGNSMVLATTALEVFISFLLDRLAETQAQPKGLWDWITHRNDYQKEPSVEEQYDILLRVYTGHSLKEDTKLWEAFKNLKGARNSFVHEGTPRIGKAPVDTATAKTLVDPAGLIISRVRDWLPSELHWKEHTHTVHIEWCKRLFP